MIKLSFHPDYVEKREKFVTYRDMYDGDQQTLKRSEYLWMHELERQVDGHGIRSIREQRSSYTNFIEPIISIWTSLFFRKDPEIPPEVETMLGDAMNNIDGKGTSLITFIKDEILTNALLYGRPILRVNALGDKPKTKAEQESTTKFRPYFEIINPLQFVDWQLETQDPDKLNKLVFCRIVYEEMQPRLNAEEPVVVKTISKQYTVNEGKLMVTRYELKKDDNTKKSTDTQKEDDTVDARQWEKIGEEILADWDEIPFVISLTGASWIKDVYPHALKYYNLESVLDNIALFQAHQRIYFIGDGLDQSKDAKAVAEYTMQILPAGVTIHTVEPVTLLGAENRLSSVLNNIFRVALNQFRMINADSAAVQSADTQKEEKDLMVALVQSELEMLENIVNQGLRLFAKYKGDDNFTAEIKFNYKVDVQDIDKMIQLVLAFRDEVANLPQTRKALLNWFVEQIDLPEKAELKAEIDGKLGELAQANSTKLPTNSLINSNFLKGLNGNQPNPKPAQSTEA